MSLVILAIGLAAASAPFAQPTPGAAVSEPQGPPTTSPLQPQTGPLAPPAGRSQPVLATPPSNAVAALPGGGGPAPAGGVTAYPASFFAAAQPNTALDMLNRLPGFTLDDGSSVRGFEAAAGNALVDGELPTSKGDDIQSILRRIPASQVERIDLIRGGAPGIDMHGKTLVANVVRRSGPSTTAVVSLSDNWVLSDGRQAPGLRLEGTRRQDGTSLEGSLLFASFIDDSAGDGPLRVTGPDGSLLGAARDNTKAAGTEGEGTAAYSRPLWGGKFRINLELQGQTYANDELVDPQGQTAAIVPSLEHDHQDTEQGEVGLHYTRDLGPRLSWESLAIEQLNGEDSFTLLSTPGEIDRFREQHTNSETIGRSTLTWRPRPDLTVEASGETAYNWLSSHTRYQTNGADVAVPAANVFVDELRGDGGLKATWVISPKLTLEVGVREEVSRIQSSGDVVLQKVLAYPKPRLVATWSPTGKDQLRMRVEHEVGQLDFNDFVAASSLSTGQILAGNPNLTPQTAWVFEGAYDRRFLKDGDVTLTLRHSELSDVIDRAPIFAPSGVYDAPANIGGGTKDELIGDLSLPLQRFGVAGGLLKSDITWRRSSVRDPTTGEERPISGLRPLEGTVDFSQDLPKWKLTWGGEFGLGWSQRYYRYDQIETDRLSPYGDLYVEVRPKPGWSVRAEMEDIGISYDRKLQNWSDVRLTGLPYDNLADRDLAFGPRLYMRVRRSW